MKPARIALALLPLMLSACRSQHIEATVENRTGAPITLLEVDYPSASFGADSLAAGASLHYRFQVRGSGPVKVQFTDARYAEHQSTGPALYEHQQGRLEIDLLPDNRIVFHPALTPAR